VPSRDREISGIRSRSRKIARFR